MASRGEEGQAAGSEARADGFAAVGVVCRAGSGRGREFLIAKKGK